MPSNRGRRSWGEEQDEDYDPSGDFINTLWEYFEEDEDRRPNSKRNASKRYNRMKNIVIRYLVSQWKPEGPKGRDLEIKLPGDKSATRVGRPPNGFVLTERIEGQLKAAGSRDEFLTLLRAAVAGTGASKKRKGSNSATQSRPQQGPRKKIKIAAGKKEKSAKFAPASEETHAELSGGCATDVGKEGLRDEAHDEGNDVCDDTGVGHAPIPRKIVLRLKTSRDNASIETQLPSPSSENDAAQRHRTDSYVSGIDAGSTQQPPTLSSLDDTAIIHEETDAGYQSDHTDDSQYPQSFSSPVVVPALTGYEEEEKEGSAGTESDFAAIQHILALAGSFNDASAKISLVNWQDYTFKLTLFCRTLATKELGFEKRMLKIKRIVYLGEEREVIGSGDWDRLAGVARLCVYLGELTGEDACDQKSAMWLSRQLKDIRWLQRALGARDQAVEQQLVSCLR